MPIIPPSDLLHIVMVVTEARRPILTWLWAAMVFVWKTKPIPMPVIIRKANSRALGSRPPIRTQGPLSTRLTKPPIQSQGLTHPDLETSMPTTTEDMDRGRILCNNLVRLG
jgi:hypothetical protein